MAHLAKVGGWLSKSVPLVLAKIGTVILFIFTLGMLLGYFLRELTISPFVLLAPFIAMIVMWKKLDEGFLVFVLLMVIFLLFPEIFSFG